MHETLIRLAFERVSTVQMVSAELPEIIEFGDCGTADGKASDIIGRIGVRLSSIAVEDEIDFAG